MMTRIKHLYIHVPFCKTICNYCDFCHRIYEENIANKWLDTLEKEIKDKCKNSYETIYIGGGTPTSLSDNQLERLLSLINPYSSECIEYTIEVNPESLTLDKINLFNKYHINRISMGVQSSDNEILKSLNRKHTFDDVKTKIQLLKDNGLSNISIDLMYSLPNQTLDILNKTIDDFLDLDIPHVSLYSLTIEENTVFGKRGIKPLNEDLEADMYELIVKKLVDNNYAHYEVSNFAREGYESKHNIGYWKYEDFLGLSLGASSKINNHRFTNTNKFNLYFNDYNETIEDIVLTKDELMFENIMMSLRMKNGLNIKEFNDKYNCDFESRYKKALSNPFIDIYCGMVKCNRLEILNTVLLDFIED